MAFKIKSDYILSEEQLQSHIKVFAGPGAGKTHFLVENIKNIIETSPIINKSRQRKILCVTYTNAAVNEIKHRLNRYHQAIDVCTIHKFIIEHIITPFQDDLKEIMSLDFGIDVNRKQRISSQIEGLSILYGYEKEEIQDYLSKKLSKVVLLNFGKKIIGSTQINIENYYKDNKIELSFNDKIDVEYVKPIKEFIWSIVGKLTHDEILYFGYRILKENSTALYALRVKFPFIFVDEFQDTSPLQTLLIKLIGENNSRIAVIGDIAQSIYSFQGATPSEFQKLNKIAENDVVEYVIEGNRRSTNNIVQLCNYIRRSDTTVIQESQKPYPSDAEKRIAEETSVKFIVGTGENAMNALNSIINSGGTVLTRQWAYAFEYIQNISNEQKKVLKNIYNSYYPTSIDIRKDIVEHNYVIWVRAFKFIMTLYDAYYSGAFSEVISAINLYFKIDRIKKDNIIKPTDIILLMNLLEKLFANLNENTLVTSVIECFNAETVGDEKLQNFWGKFGNSHFLIDYISEYDSDSFKTNLNKIEWATATKLFREVFSANSKYMTVHQAKGLEWDKIIVGVQPSTKNDCITLQDFWSNPQLLQESPADEFSRIYYVACSRACKELYIHLTDTALHHTIKQNLDNFIEKSNCNLNYEFII